MSRNEDYTTRNLLDYLYHQKYYKPIGIDLSRQADKASLSEQNFGNKLRNMDFTFY